MKFENTEVFNFEGALRGMRLPMQSGNKADSYLQDCSGVITYHIGENDMKLAQRLVGAGSPHDKFLRQIFVSVDITAPLYWWKEMDQYKVGTVTDSESTMHKLASTPITLDCFETDDYDPDLVYEEGKEVQRMTTFENEPISWNVDSIICFLESLRQKYNKTKDKRYWKELIRWLPESWLQTRTWTANYAVLRSIYFQRKDHRLTEWHQFCDWIKTLPYAAELITYERGGPDVS